MCGRTRRHETLEKRCNLGMNRSEMDHKTGRILSKRPHHLGVEIVRQFLAVVAQELDFDIRD
jgi:hypothetical protein